MTRSALIRLALFVVMEASWIGALALFVDAALAGASDPAVLWVTALYPAGFVAEQVIRRMRSRGALRWAVRAAAFVAIAALVMFLAFPAGARAWDATGPMWLLGERGGHRILAFLAVGVFCWARGTMLAGRELSTDAVALGFQIGLVVLMGVLGFSAGFAIRWTGAELLTLGFVASGLLTLWHIRADTRRNKGDTGRRNPLVALLGLALVLLFGLGIAAITDRAVLDQIVGFISRIGEAIGWLLSRLLSLIPGVGEDVPEGNLTDVKVSGEEPPPLLLIPEFLRRYFGIGMFSAFGLALAIIIMVSVFSNLRALAAWLEGRPKRTPGLDIDRSSHGFGDTLRSLGAAFGAWWGRLTQRFRRPPRDTHVSVPMRLGYLKMESWLARRGWPRLPNETPNEYAARLKGAWPAAGADLELMTRGYVNARYGFPRRVTPRRMRKLLKRIRRSVDKVRYREAHAEH